jgi:exonuclease SbcC
MVRCGVSSEHLKKSVTIRRISGISVPLSYEGKNKMKILKVTIQNLNSLRVRTTIDFTATPLSNSGLFAITGDTGAGKTTILDAITLALYGRIHRNKEVTEVMSYGATESLAEVEFETKGAVYRSRWAIWRARKQLDGKIQFAEREVSKWNADKTEFEIIAKKIQEANEAVEAITDLDFDRFCRSVLLSQGDFAAFLKAGEKERSELLERITGTEIYSKLSRAAFERNKLESEKLQQLKRERELLQLLDAENVAQLQTNLKNCQSEAEDLKIRIETLQTKLRQIQRYRQLQQESEKLAQDVQQLETDGKATRLENERLNAHLQTIKTEWTSSQPLFSQVSTLDAIIFEQSQALLQTEKNWKITGQKREEQQSALLLLEQQIVQLETSIAQLQTWLNQHQHLAQLREALPTIAYQQQEFQKIWQEWQHLETTKTAFIEKHEQLFLDLETGQSQLQSFENQLNELRNQFKQAAPENYAQDRNEYLTLLYEDIERLSEQRKNLETLYGLTNEYQRLLHQLAEYEDRREEWQHEESQINKELLTSLEALEQAEARRQFKQQIYEDQLLIANYEKDRSRLKEGDRCPLCFSMHHPFRHEHGKPYVDFARQELDTALKVFEELGKNHRKLLMRQSELSQQIDRLTGNELKPLSGEVERLFDKILEYEEKIALVSPEFQNEQLSLTQNTFLHRKISEAEEQIMRKRHIREKLLKLNRALEQQEKQHQEMAARLKQLQTELLLTEEKLASAQEQWRRGQVRLESATAQLNELLAPYNFSFEIKTAAAVLQNLQNLSETYVSNYKKQEDFTRKLAFSRRDADNLQKQLSELTQLLETQSFELQQKRQQLHAQQNQRIQLFGNKNPVLEQEILQTKLDTAEQTLLQSQQQLAQLNQQLEGTRQRFADRQQELQQLPTPEVEESVVSQQLEDTGSKFHRMLEQIGEIRHELKQQETAEQAAEKLTQHIHNQQKEQTRWAKLKDIIGSADGKEFRVFAQGLTLKRVTQLANRYLQHLNGRYWIEKRDGKDLDLEIVDTYQADNRRSMNTLSGGESFLVSLALALGLSDLAGSNAHIQSLFIDEGFGTLDDNSLDLAITTLENLQASGKTIGVISHVKELKERITAQIRVKKQSNGFSEIEIVG